MFSIDKTLINPNMPVTVRFSSVLYEWLRNKADKEEISFNQMVLQCCKYVILSILVDTFISKISFPMQPGPEIGSISDA